jgi:hypothetical protein
MRESGGITKPGVDRGGSERDDDRDNEEGIKEVFKKGD